MGQVGLVVRPGAFPARGLSEHRAEEDLPCRWVSQQRSLRDLVTRLNDQEIDTLFELARTDGIMPIVRKTAQFNHHRHLIRALLRHPPARKVLFRSVFG